MILKNCKMLLTNERFYVTMILMGMDALFLRNKIVGSCK